MRTRLGVGLMAVLLALYLFVCLQYSYVAFAAGTLPGVVMGVGLLILGGIGVWGLVRELLFGVRAERLARRLEEEDALPQEVVVSRASGRPLREEADALFPRYAEEVDAHPESWRAWYRLGLVYDAGGDRKRARGAIRRSISLERDAPA
ncbi:hypothetical protein SAMN06295885_2977 [Rathayibacter oskolensis]|uniref:Tetratricopeptide repeat-containing protein n=1 Tax=Rathayibacter oskolensis TaxID=1891671 RepID=A0A1X7P9B3_9MICO|nr:hypothetical protein [Rathayibacter oskolensis]SMH47446.1 hypothetical protein SAMN06295885_2977 [Rathayibacter oskolensis]